MRKYFSAYYAVYSTDISPLTLYGLAPSPAINPL